MKPRLLVQIKFRIILLLISGKTQEIFLLNWRHLFPGINYNFFSKDGEVSVEEFKRGIEGSCKGKTYKDLPEAFKFFIDSSFRTIDIDGQYRTNG